MANQLVCLAFTPLYNVAMLSPVSSILTVRDLPWPAPWPGLFGREAPLWMEIGFGGAGFLIELATMHPEVNVLGVEVSQPSLRKAVRKANHRSLPNLRVVYAGAQPVLWALCAPASLAAVFINFPDPWPKPAQQQRRLISKDLLNLLASRQENGAPLEIATDDPGYAEVIGSLLSSSPYYTNSQPQLFVNDDPSHTPTKYEQKARAEGRVCFYFKWRRNKTRPRDRFPVPMEYAMPHVILRNTLSLQEILVEPLEATHSEGGVTVRFIGVFASPAEDFVLVDTHIEEEPVSQRVALSIRLRAENELILGLHELGFPRKTKGVHYALAFLTRQLQALQPETHVVQSNLTLSLT